MLHQVLLPTAYLNSVTDAASTVGDERTAQVDVAVGAGGPTEVPELAPDAPPVLTLIDPPAVPPGGEPAEPPTELSDDATPEWAAV